MTNLATDTTAPAYPASRLAIPPGSASGLRTDDLHRIAVAIDAEVAASTRTTYASGWRNWESWCHRRGLVALPADSDALAAYLTECAEAGLCNGTLDGDCAAIAHRHHQEGLGDPTAAAVVRRVRRGLRRILGTAPRRQAHPLPSPSSLRSWRASTRNLASASATAPFSCWDTRPRCVPARSPHSIWRTSASAATACSSPFDVPRPIRRGSAMWSVSPPDFTPPPIRSAPSATGLASAPPGPGRCSPACQPPARSRARASALDHQRLVRDRAAAAGLGDLGVSGHTLRAGHATTAAVNGAPIDRIAAQTRHRDLTTLFNHYIRPADALANTTSRDLGL